MQTEVADETIISHVIIINAIQGTYRFRSLS